LRLIRKNKKVLSFAEASTINVGAFLVYNGLIYVLFISLR